MAEIVNPLAGYVNRIIIRTENNQPLCYNWDAMNARNTAYTIQRQLDSRRAVLRWQEDELMKEPPTFAEIGQKIAEFIQSPNPAIQHLKKPQEPTWTTEYPTEPGYYWLRKCKLGRWPTSIPKPVIATVDKKLEVYLGVPPNESNLPYFRSDVLSAEWFGPIQPPADKEGK